MAYQPVYLSSNQSQSDILSDDGVWDEEEGKGGRREGVHGCRVTILRLNMLEFQWDRGVNDDRCNSQSHAELRLRTWLAHDALHLFVSLSRQRDAVPLQHLHSCDVMKARRQIQRQTGGLSIPTQDVVACQQIHFPPFCV